MTSPAAQLMSTSCLTHEQSPLPGLAYSAHAQPFRDLAEIPTPAPPFTNHPPIFPASWPLGLAPLASLPPALLAPSEPRSVRECDVV